MSLEDAQEKFEWL